MITREILIYQNLEDRFKVEVRLEEEIVWLTQEQMAIPFWKSQEYHYRKPERN